MSVVQSLVKTAYLVPLSAIRDNPWQTRLIYDDDKLADLAVSIHDHMKEAPKSYGLFETPEARIVDEDGELLDVKGTTIASLMDDKAHVELAFGHRRRRAFELLLNGFTHRGTTYKPDKRFNVMPLYIERTDDRRMAEKAIEENARHADLNWWENAAAMVRYMGDFDATQAEAAATFGYSQPAISQHKRAYVGVRQFKNPWLVEAAAVGELSLRHALALLPAMEQVPEALSLYLTEGRHQDKHGELLAVRVIESHIDSLIDRHLPGRHVQLTGGVNSPVVVHPGLKWWQRLRAYSEQFAKEYPRRPIVFARSAGPEPLFVSVQQGLVDTRMLAAGVQEYRTYPAVVGQSEAWLLVATAEVLDRLVETYRYHVGQYVEPDEAMREAVEAAQAAKKATARAATEALLAEQQARVEKAAKKVKDAQPLAPNPAPGVAGKDRPYTDADRERWEQVRKDTAQPPPPAQPATVAAPAWAKAYRDAINEAPSDLVLFAVGESKQVLIAAQEMTMLISKVFPNLGAVEHQPGIGPVVKLSKLHGPTMRMLAGRYEDRLRIVESDDPQLKMLADRLKSYEFGGWDDVPDEPAPRPVADSPPEREAPVELPAVGQRVVHKEDGRLGVVRAVFPLRGGSHQANVMWDGDDLPEAVGVEHLTLRPRTLPAVRPGVFDPGTVVARKKDGQVGRVLGRVVQPNGAEMVRLRWEGDVGSFMVNPAELRTSAALQADHSRPPAWVTDDEPAPAPPAPANTHPLLAAVALIETAVALLAGVEIETDDPARLLLCTHFEEMIRRQLKSAIEGMRACAAPAVEARLAERLASGEDEQKVVRDVAMSAWMAAKNAAADAADAAAGEDTAPLLRMTESGMATSQPARIEDVLASMDEQIAERATAPAEDHEFPVMLGDVTVFSYGISVQHSAQYHRLRVTQYGTGRSGQQKNKHMVVARLVTPLGKRLTLDDLQNVEAAEVLISTGGAVKATLSLAEWRAFVDRVPVKVSAVSRTTVERSPQLVQMARDVAAFRRPTPTDDEWAAEMANDDASEAAA